MSSLGFVEREERALHRMTGPTGLTLLPNILKYIVYHMTICILKSVFRKGSQFHDASILLMVSHFKKCSYTMHYGQWVYSLWTTRSVGAAHFYGFLYV